jgi:hypothetical protein
MQFEPLKAGGTLRDCLRDCPSGLFGERAAQVERVVGNRDGLPPALGGDLQRVRQGLQLQLRRGGELRIVQVRVQEVFEPRASRACDCNPQRRQRRTRDRLLLHQVEPCVVAQLLAEAFRHAQRGVGRHNQRVRREAMQAGVGQHIEFHPRALNRVGSRRAHAR